MTDRPRSGRSGGDDDAAWQHGLDGELDRLGAHETSSAVEDEIRRQIAAEGARRAARWADDQLADAGVAPRFRPPPPPLRYPRWGWRQAVRFAVTRKMLTVPHGRAALRCIGHRERARLQGQRVLLHGMVFVGRRVELVARRGHGVVSVGPWSWVGDGTALRAHEGHLVVGTKVVFGRLNVINAYLDIEVGDESLFADWVYVTDFDHRFDRWDMPIRRQGIAVSPVRVGGDVWLGEKASVLRGADIGYGSVVASHAVVKGVVPAFSIVAGVPARVVRSRLPVGMTPEEALARIRGGVGVPGDPIDT